ncbi:MAG: VWA domain-containing protein, partial [Deltaproteobacteria bacterium]|nr:VWA domain-containing protein [Deltaproteobacteria bacterium]
LAPLREMLRMYCRAISERSVELQDSQQLIDKNIGWLRDDVATSDGAAIFLPAAIERFESRPENFAFLKVMLTQQSGHIEFGSFEFQFDRPSTRFADLRPRLKAPPDEHGHHRDQPTATELTRFFRLFPNKRLALDTFAIVESARIEARVIHEYPGIAPLYRVMRERVLTVRHEIVLLPAREALLELLIRVSLGQSGALKVPAAQKIAADEIVRMIRSACAHGATVEDGAEATLRIYALLSRVANEFLEENQFAAIDIEEEGSSRSNRSNGSNRWEEVPGTGEVLALSAPAIREKAYMSPQGVDYRGEFKPELAQLLSKPRSNAREERNSLTPEELAELLKSRHSPKPKDSEEESEEQDPQIERMVQNLMRELERRDPRMRSVQQRPWFQSDDDAGSLTANQADTFIYDEWDQAAGGYRSRWCKLYEKVMPAGDLNFYRDTLLNYAGLARQIRREFELAAPELHHKEKRLPDGSDHDLDAAIEAMVDLRIGVSPSEKIFWRNHKAERDVAVAFLLDMSGSTGEAIGRAPGASPFEGRLGDHDRAPRRIIDVEKEAIVLMIDALETIGDRYGVFGFSGHGRDNVEFFVIKDIDEAFSPEVAKRIGRVGPLHATRMGPAIRHATSKLRRQQTRSMLLFLISDGRPQDRGYSQESAEKAYAVQDTRMALIEARRDGIQPFCLTVDKEGNDYLRTMMEDFSYEVLADVNELPLRLPQLYRRLTM